MILAADVPHRPNCLLSLIIIPVRRNRSIKDIELSIYLIFVLHEHPICLTPFVAGSCLILRIRVVASFLRTVAHNDPRTIIQLLYLYSQFNEALCVYVRVSLFEYIVCHIVYVLLSILYNAHPSFLLPFRTCFRTRKRTCVLCAYPNEYLFRTSLVE